MPTAEPHRDPAPIAQVDPGAYYRAHRDEALAALARVLDGGWYILGREVAAFEQAFAQALGAGHAVGVASGTDALILALRALGVGPGDRVATVSHTAVATVAAIHAVGAEPVWVDIEPDYYTMSPAGLEQALRTAAPIAAVVVVHLYGQPAALPELLALAARHGVPLLEDCAQAHGARLDGQTLGTFGALAAFSFYPTKNLGAMGDGGMVLSASAEHAALLRSLREYGWRERYISELPGMNSRLDELQAALLALRLPTLASDNQRRQEHAHAYLAGLRGSQPGLPALRPGAVHAWHQFVLRHPQRDALRAHLAARGIATGIHYPVPVHLQPAYAGRGILPAGGLPESERAAREVLSLPMYAELAPDALARVVTALREWR